MIWLLNFHGQSDSCWEPHLSSTICISLDFIKFGNLCRGLLELYVVELKTWQMTPF